MNRNLLGRFKSKFDLTDKILGSIILLAITAAAIATGIDTLKGKELSARNIFIAHAEELPIEPSLTIEQLEAKLDAIVWGGESEKLVMGEGDIFPVFDPSSSMYERCAKIGGKQHKDCISYGPRQEKIGTIQYYWPKLYDGKTLTDREARDVAEGNESSRRFFLDCAVKIVGCANNWTTFQKHAVEGQVYIDLIREAKGI